MTSARTKIEVTNSANSQERNSADHDKVVIRYTERHSSDSGFEGTDIAEEPSLVCTECGGYAYSSSLITPCQIHNPQSLLRPDLSHMKATYEESNSDLRLSRTLPGSCMVQHGGGFLPGSSTVQHGGGSLPSSCTVQHGGGSLPGSCAVQHGGGSSSNSMGMDKPAFSSNFFSSSPESRPTCAQSISTALPSPLKVTKPVGARSHRVLLPVQNKFTSNVTKPEFSVEGDSDFSDLSGSTPFFSAPEPIANELGKKCDPDSKLDTNTNDTKERSRFKKLFEPLRRSQSAVNGKEVPPHALFLSDETFSSVEQLSEKKVSGLEKRKDEISRSAKSSPNIANTSHLSTLPNYFGSKEIKSKKGVRAEVRKFFSFKGRSGGDVNSLSPIRDGKLDRVTVESWATSIEVLLRDKYGLQLFREFLKSEFSEENLEFWVACNEYKALGGNQTAQQLNCNAHKIFTEFVMHQAAREINIDAITRDLTYANMEEPSLATFDAAQRRIQALMDKDSYPRFLQSPSYMQLLSPD